ncbi:TPA: hypothetical protein HA246_01980 [Candidatus Woesearchaeota archaeon]|nr:hypothetical protein [Candidatus Woesearchaeota archaeon]
MVNLPIPKELVDIVVREFETIRDFYYKKPVVGDRALLIRPDLVPQRRHGFCVDKSLYLAAFYQVLFTRFAKGRDLEEGLEQEVKEYLQRFNNKTLRVPAVEERYARIARGFYAWDKNFYLPEKFMNDKDISTVLKSLTDHFFLQIRYPGTKTWIDVDASWPSYFERTRFRVSRRWTGRDNTKKTVEFSSHDQDGSERTVKPYYLGDTRLYTIVTNYPGRTKFHDVFDRWVEEVNGITFEKAMAQSLTPPATRTRARTGSKPNHPVTY